MRVNNLVTAVNYSVITGRVVNYLVTTANYSLMTENYSSVNYLLMAASYSVTSCIIHKQQQIIN